MSDAAISSADRSVVSRFVTDVLGRERPIDRVYEDGGWSCPFCWSGVDPSRACDGRRAGYAAACETPIHCQNPACFANPHYPRERARERAREELAKAERSAREEANRKVTHEWAMKRSAEEARARADRLQAISLEADQRGACRSCALHEYRTAGRMKFTKHRKACPRV